MTARRPTPDHLARRYYVTEAGLAALAADPVTDRPDSRAGRPRRPSIGDVDHTHDLAGRHPVRVAAEARVDAVLAAPGVLEDLEARLTHLEEEVATMRANRHPGDDLDGPDTRPDAWELGEPGAPTPVEQMSPAELRALERDLEERTR